MNTVYSLHGLIGGGKEFTNRIFHLLTRCLRARSKGICAFKKAIVIDARSATKVDEARSSGEAAYYQPLASNL